MSNEVLKNTSEPFNTATLNPDKPVDSFLIKIIGQEEGSLSDDQLHGLLEAMAQGLPEADSQFVRHYRDYIGAAAHYFNGGTEGASLLVAAKNSVLFAVRTHKRPGKYDFALHLTNIVARNLHEATYGTPADSEQLKQHVEGISGLVENIRVERDKERRRRVATRGFSALEREVISLLPLQTHEAIAEQLGRPVDSINNALSRCFDKTDKNSTPALAIEMLKRGYPFDIPEPPKPLYALLDDDEMEIAHLLELPYEEIGHETGNTYDDIRWKVDFMKRKTGARTRIELALMVKMYDTGERGTDAILAKNLYTLASRIGLKALELGEAELLLEYVPPTQSEPIRQYFLTGYPNSWANVGSQLGIPENAARVRAGRGIRAMKKIAGNLLAAA